MTAGLGRDKRSDARIERNLAPAGSPGAGRRLPGAPLPPGVGRSPLARTRGALVARVTVSRVYLRSEVRRLGDRGR